MKLMKMNYIMFIFLGLFLISSSSTWVFCWMGMEVLGYFFLVFFFLSSKEKSFLSVISLKYFSIQVFCSVMFFYISLMNMSLDFSLNYGDSLIYLIMIVKLGLFPFFFWMIDIIKIMKFLSMMIFLIFMKLGPLMILNYYISENLSVYFMFMTLMFGSFLILYEKDFSIMVLMSSVSNLGWIFLSMKISLFMFYIFFNIYAGLMISLIDCQSKMNLNSKTEIFEEFSKENFYYLGLVFFSLSGLPPFLMFYPKVAILYNSGLEFSLLMVVIMSFLGLLTLVIYLNQFIYFLNYEDAFFMTLVFKKSKAFIIIISSFVFMMMNLILFIYWVN